MPQLSVIVPVYNTGEYLRTCVSSISNQTLQDLEILIIDDGSQKLTADICDDLAKLDTRIKVVHTANKGVSVARNLGLELAKGDYVAFVDSDDTIDLMMFESLIDILQKNNAQIAMCDATTICYGKLDEDDTIDALKESSILEKKDISPAILIQLAGSVWRCVYTRIDILETYKIRFPEGVKFSEDRIFNILAMGVATRIAYLKKSYYRRLIRKGSACFRFYPDMTEQIVKMRIVLLDAVRKFWSENYVKEYEKQISGQIKYAITNYTALYNNCNIITQISLLKKLCNNVAIKDCLQASTSKDFRSRLIQKGMYRVIFLLGLLTNIYHKLCHKGQYQW